MKTSSELLGEALERARHHWKRRSTAGFTLPPGPSAKPPLSIAISRDAGSLGNEIGQAVGEQLGWTVYDRELVEEIAKKIGLRTELLESVDERETSWLADCLKAFSGGPHVNSITFAHELAHVLTGLSAHGDCVIVGRGAVAILPQDRTLRIRIIADWVDRVQRIRQRLDCSEKEAKQVIDKTDRERVAFVKNYFQKDITSVYLYDLALNSSRFTTTQCAQMIVHALRTLQNGH